jgi:hypothetical protein
MAKTLADAGARTSSMEETERRLDGTYEKGLEPAPPDGLVLWDIGYDIGWIPLERGERRKSEIEDRKGYHHVMSHICEIFGNGSDSS